MKTDISKMSRDTFTLKDMATTIDRLFRSVLDNISWPPFGTIDCPYRYELVFAWEFLAIFFEKNFHIFQNGKC